MKKLSKYFKILKQNEFLREQIARQIHENLRLEKKLMQYELTLDGLMADESDDEWEDFEVCGSEMYQRCFIGSEFADSWTRGQVKKEICEKISDIIDDYIMYTTQVTDDKHCVLTGMLDISVKLPKEIKE